MKLELRGRVMTKVSIIVPVYNVVEFLPKCLDSLICQTVNDIEIICINDGSTDNSLEILKNYAQKDKRIIVINKENAGVAAARNEGLEAARGEYIMFLDSDDYFVSPESCRKAYNSIREADADIGIFGFYNLIEETKTEPSYRTLRLQQMIKGEIDIDYYTFQASIWDKIYKRSFLNNNHIRFANGLKTAEDVVFCFSTNFAKPKYCLLDEILLVYRTDREGSVTTKNFGAVKSDFESLKYFISTEIFAKQSVNVQLRVIDRFLGGALYFYNKLPDNVDKSILFGDIRKLLKFVEKYYDKKLLKQLPNYHPLKTLIKSRGIKFISQIFSVVNSKDKRHKIITVLGIKIKLRRKSQ